MSIRFVAIILSHFLDNFDEIEIFYVRTLKTSGIPHLTVAQIYQRSQGGVQHQGNKNPIAARQNMENTSLSSSLQHSRNNPNLPSTEMSNPSYQINPTLIFEIIMK